MIRFLSLLVSLTLLVAAGGVLAHGESDESVAEFHLHLDDYSGEIDAFVAEVDSIVEAHRAGEDARGGIDGLIERWEEVAVHGAIETHAMVTYPTIWQRMLGLQQAVLEGQPAPAVAEAADALEASLWQGFGALRLAAARRDAGDGHDEAHHAHDDDHHHGDHEHGGDHDHDHHSDADSGGDR